MVNMILLLLLLRPLYAIEGVVPEPGVACAASACYTVHIENIAFEDARKSCEDSGGNLATMKDRTEAQEVRSVLSRFEGTVTNHGFKFWIGLKLHKGSCTFTERNLKGFKWVSGDQDTEYSNWEKEPEITCTEDRCVAVHWASSSMDSGSQIRWTDRSCKDMVGFICKFNFKGMCKPLLLAGHGKVKYTTPFVTSPLSEGSALTMLPHGTSAEVLCDDGPNYTICMKMNGFFGWTKSGLFCDSKKQGCTYKNGGCDHFCVERYPSGIRCECKDGFKLGEDGVTCVQRDNCLDSPCKFKCVSNLTGFACICPDGFHLAKDQTSCIDIDECLSQVCGNHTCNNIEGSYSCNCRKGYRWINEKCEDIDECLESSCHQGCLNLPGSFSCYCFLGYRTSEDGLGCVDNDECFNSPCEQNCTNTVGSFKCSCRKNFVIAANGVNCIPNTTGESGGHRGEEHGINGQNTGDQILEASTILVSTSLTGTISPNIIKEESTSIGYEGTPRGTIVHSDPNAKDDKTDHTNNSVHQVNNFSKTWIVACVVGSVVALVFVITVISVFVVCRLNRQKKDAKKQNSTTDSYCWVSSGHVAQTEKL